MRPSLNPSRADLAALVVAAAVSIGVLAFDPDVESGWRAGGIVLAVVAATLLGVAGFYIYELRRRRRDWTGRG